MSADQKHPHFRLVKKLYIEEIKSTLFEYEHLKTKAPIIHLQNEDPENLFVVSFPTYPDSSNGVFHILEHTVLCGSQKYPIKDPFFSMLRRSLATFMNAMTGSDFTCYPASSQIEKDFYQLFEVYLDAVFHPLLKELSFQQEGWRLEFTDPADPSSPLMYKGVVYNEMKGARSSIDERLHHTLMQHLTPDLPYSYETGGLPKDIPSLTYKELLLAHQKFYHPSHGIFFFYGNLPTEKHLTFLEEKCLKNFSQIPPLKPLPKQKRFTQPLDITAYYPLAENDHDTDQQKIILALGFLTCSIQNQNEALALSLLEHILFATDASLVCQPLLESGLCLEVDSSLNLEMSEIPWLITLKGVEKEKQHKALKLLETTLENIAEEKIKIPAPMIEAALHQLEFSGSEISRHHAPYGLHLFFQAALAKHHGIELEKNLQIHKLFKMLTEALKDPHFLTNLLKKYLIDNSHKINLTMLPDQKLHQKELAEEKADLKNKEQILTPLEKKNILENSQKLISFQNEKEASLDCLPIFPISQIPHPVIDFPLSHENLPNLDFCHYTTFTNQILYADLLFDLPTFTLEEMPVLTLFVYLLPQIGCKTRSYSENLRFISSNLGNFSLTLTLNPQAKDSNLLAPALSLRSKALKRKTPFLFQFLKEMAQTADFSNKKRIQELFLAQASLLENNLPNNALSYAMRDALSNINLHHFLNNELSGLPYFRFIQKTKANLDQQLDIIIPQLQAIQEKIFSQKPSLVITAQKDFFPLSKDCLNSLDFVTKNSSNNLSRQSQAQTKAIWQNPAYSLKRQSSAKAIPAPVAFNAYALKAPSYLDPSAPYLLLSTFLMENLYLHSQIREKGGAYGAGANYHNGSFYFYSYRDPQIKDSLEAFKTAITKIAEGHFTQSKLEEAIRGALRDIEEPLSPGGKGIHTFFLEKTGYTKEIRQKFKDKLLSASKEHISQAVKEHLLNQEGDFSSFAERKLLETKLPPDISIESI